MSQQLNTQYLREFESQSKASQPNIIPNNAWKRQLDQVIKKATLTRYFGGAFALVMGEVLYDYVRNSVAVGKEYFPGWEIALIGMTERPSQEAGSIPFDNVSKVVFMTYGEFIAALQDINLSRSTPNPFLGEYTTLRNRTFTVA